MSIPPGRTPRGPVQVASAAVGTIFLLVAILGFVPGITTNYSHLELFGPHSEAMLLTVFNVSVVHNMVHALFGLAGLRLARTVAGARAFLIWGGTLYLALWLYGVFIPLDSRANFLPLNTADNWLHLALGLGMIGLGALLGRRGRHRMI